LGSAPHQPQQRGSFELSPPVLDSHIETQKRRAVRPTPGSATVGQTTPTDATGAAASSQHRERS
jgi:hypothetical protein